MPPHLLAAERLRTLLRAHEMAGNRSGLLMVSSADLRDVLEALPQSDESDHSEEAQPPQGWLPYRDD